MYNGACRNEHLENGIVVVHVTGPLEHHEGWWWDSYESILMRVEDAMTGADEQKEHAFRNAWRDDFQALPATKPRAIVIKIDSPGGEAAGATYAHRRLRALSRKHDVPLYAFANEMACSAAYEIASACDEIWLPDTGMIGSIGVIATLFDRTKMNEKYGLAIELITSGEYKADNHADRPIDDGVRKRMRERVMELAAIFWKVVAQARNTTPSAIQSLQAGVFVGQDAVDVGIADGVANWDKFLKTVENALDSSEEIADGAAAPAA